MPRTARRLHATAQEAVVAALRETLLLSLDDLLAVTREFIHPEVSRSGLDRGLRRHGVPNLETLMPWEAGAKMPVKPVKAYDPGCVHVESSICPTCRMRTIGSTALPRLTAPPAGSTSNASRTSQPPLPAFPLAPDRQGPLHDHQGPHR